MEYKFKVFEEKKKGCRHLFAGHIYLEKEQDVIKKLIKENYLPPNSQYIYDCDDIGGEKECFEIFKIHTGRPLMASPAFILEIVKD